MKTGFLIFLSLHLCIACSFGQVDAKPLLMTPGAELEYRCYLPKTGLIGKSGFVEVTTLTYTVSSVIDSSGTAISTVLKKGKSIKRNDSYQHAVYVKNDGKNLFFSADYYVIDTLYVADVYYRLRYKSVYRTTVIKGPDLEYPLQPAEGALPKNNYDYQMLIHDPVEKDWQANALGSSFPSFISDKKIKTQLIITSRSIVGKETVKVPAGTFDCYKIKTSFEWSARGLVNKGLGSTIEYYAPGTGVIKTEQINQEGPVNAYMELTRIKK
jgi:hypothetical protein